MDDIGTSPRADQLGVGAISHQLRCTGDVIALDHLAEKTETLPSRSISLVFLRALVNSSVQSHT